MSSLATNPLHIIDNQHLAASPPLSGVHCPSVPSSAPAAAHVDQSFDNPALGSTPVDSCPPVTSLTLLPAQLSDVAVNLMTSRPELIKPASPSPPLMDDNLLQLILPSDSPNMSPHIVPPPDVVVAPMCTDSTRELISAALRLITQNSPLMHAPTLREFLQAALVNMPDMIEIQLFLNSHAELQFPTKWRPSKPRLPPTYRANTSRKHLRRLQYGHIQTLYNRCRRDAANTVLDGRWRSPHTSSPFSIPEFETFWKTIFTTPSTPDNRPVVPVLPMCPALLDPITPDEITWALKDMRNSAPGVDRLSAQHFLNFDVPSLAGYLNMVLAFKFLPTNLSISRVTFIPKGASPQQPNDFRPISIAPVITRCLHKILAKRWMPLFPSSKLQFAFLQRDGCFEAINLLHSLLRHAHERHSGCSIALLDISRAFDSVSHHSILRAAHRFGAPDGLCQYLQRVYNGSTSLFNTVDCAPSRGVKQGDPLSPLLFIMSLDEALESIETDSPVIVDGLPISYIAYADDLVILAPNADLLQKKLDKLASLLQRSGLIINTSKSMSIDLIAGGHSKLTALKPTVFKIDGNQLQRLNVSDHFDFLGISFDYKGRSKMDHVETLSAYLLNLTQAPLKPQQRMSILRENLEPRLLYPLTIGVVHKCTLRQMDCLIRSSVRKWLRLPSDTPTSFFHSSISTGGLGIPHLSSIIPLHRRKRAAKLLLSPCPIIRWVSQSPSFSNFLRICNLPINVHRDLIHSFDEARCSWSKQLHSTCDGRGLSMSSRNTVSHLWLRYPEHIFPRLYINAIKLRGGLLSTKVRRSRGRQENADLLCRGRCGHHESIQHILQHCSLTHDIRCRRHNDICRLVASRLRRNNIRFFQEPCIPTPVSFCKPDFIIIRDSIAYVLDVSVCDDANVHLSRQLKINKYGCSTVVSSIYNFLNATGLRISSVRQTPLIITYRGLIDPLSTTSLRRLSFSSRDISDLCVASIQGSMRIYNTYMRGTSPQDP